MDQLTMTTMAQPSVLIFDDEASTTVALTRFLQQSYKVLAAKDPDEFEKALSEQPALIFCDLILPAGSGLAFLKKASEVSPVSARILISGFLNQETLLQAINQDLAHRVLAKPWTLEQLGLVTAEAYNVHRLLVDRLYWQEVSLTDSLTHLWNRRGLLQHLLKETDRARRHQRPLSVLMVDLDHFKRVNDGQGHAAGDEVLRQLARALTESVRSSDWVCRYGGDEFVVILPETPRQESYDVAERIRTTVKEKLELSVSLGVALFPFHGQDPASLIEAADRALYSAKTQGRNQTVIAAFS